MRKVIYSNSDYEGDSDYNLSKKQMETENICVRARMISWFLYIFRETHRKYIKVSLFAIAGRNNK